MAIAGCEGALSYTDFIQVQPDEEETVEPATEVGAEPVTDGTASPSPTAGEGGAETESEVLLAEPPPPPPPKEILQPLDITPFVRQVFTGYCKIKLTN